jgi:hypothetical protein
MGSLIVCKPFGGDLNNLQGIKSLEHSTIGTGTSTAEVRGDYENRD